MDGWNRKGRRDRAEGFGSYKEEPDWEKAFVVWEIGCHI